MKKILIILTLFSGLIACENQESEFPDFDYTTGYFPYQYPVRTLVLGDYIYDNTNDKNHKFLISAAMGGVYSNTQDRIFDIEVGSSLCNEVLFASTLDTIRLLPQAYYTLSSSSKLVIPAGEVNGSIEVQLKDAFFDDPLAIKLGYVLPIRIVNATNLDSVLRGKSSKVNPDPRVVNQWAIQPKDFTMYAINFINPYHGKYLHRGASTVKDGSGAILESNVYRTTYIVNNEIWSLVTTGKNRVTVQGNARSTLIPGVLKMNLTFANDGTCTINEATGSTFIIRGNGKFTSGADSWGGKPRDAIRINYQLTSGANTYSATDTLVIRDRAITMQLYTPKVF
ncbi:MAG: DUF5627 domain-containing protein [Prolixibacteraceae bacterium]|jgi:hypothetical protein|nr:DUF5627 domain-containing protein [Prolixibacteraceae bacterium]